MREELIESSHDVSDGGVLIALAEKMMGTPYGMNLEIKGVNEKDILGFLFNESAGRFVVTVNPNDQKEFEDNLTGHFFMKLGVTTNDEKLMVHTNEQTILNVTGSECMKNYKVEVEGLV
jgi:phosphoribosylformylglycinamidine synthase